MKLLGQTLLVIILIYAFGITYGAYEEYTYVQIRVLLTDAKPWKSTYGVVNSTDFKSLENEVCNKIRNALDKNSTIINAYIGCSARKFQLNKTTQGHMQLQFYTDKYVGAKLTPEFLALFLNRTADKTYFIGFCKLSPTHDSNDKCGISVDIYENKNYLKPKR
ncbi:unnamed protein product [Calicophoron daubneyi]|uniref:Uncharacterized protein n=1 Tax=Calicophoron daubneyi TaxID=300641 RepID=A0AAV2TEJ8_CALDB